MDRQFDPLRGALDRLGTAEALALARKLETQRVIHQVTLPADEILAALRPRLQRARPARVQTLCRLAAAGFADFLVDGDEEIRLPGVIPRGAVSPWWQSLEIMAPQEIKDYERRLAQLTLASDWPAIVWLGHAVRRAACQWTAAILAGIKHPKRVAPLIRKFLGDLGLQTDFAEIMRILAIEEPLSAALDAVLAVAARSGEAREGRILEFGPDSVGEATRQYARFAELHGGETRYMALGILNRLERPWQILRLGRALAWEPTDVRLGDGEFGIAGRRLVHGLQALAREAETSAPSPRRAGGARTDYARLQNTTARYFDTAEGMLAEAEFRRGSQWAERILETHAALARALDAGRLAIAADAVLAVLPMKRGPRGLASDDPDLDGIPAPETVEDAMQAARFLVLLARRGSRHGLSSPARAVLDGLGRQIGYRAGRLYDELVRDPSRQPIAAQLDAAIRAGEILFEDGRTQVMARRLDNLRRAPARA